MNTKRDETIKVYLRVRPPIYREVKYEVAVLAQGDQALTVYSENKETTCTYDHVFGEIADQAQVFEAVKPLLVDVLSGINGCIFAYGQTSSGKSHTMIGPNGGQDIIRIDPEMWGILPRASEFLLGYLNEKSSEGNLTYSVKASFMQIYNENLYDLLRDTGSKFDDRPLPTSQEGDLKIREVPKPKSQSSVTGAINEIYVSGLSEFRVQTADDILKILAFGTTNRMTRSTDYNATSSRSHALLTLTFEIETQIESGQTLISRSKLHLIDLAGSEKMSNVSLDSNNPKHVKELSSINKSLSALGNVISALASTSRSHIPYRDSKLTRILQDSLGGNSRTVLIACVAPTVLHSMETLSTLQFAERAKNVRITVKANTVIDDKVTLAKAQAEISRLKVLLSHALKQLEEKTSAMNSQLGAGGINGGIDGNGGGGGNTAEYEALVIENDELRRQNESLRRLARNQSYSASDDRGQGNHKHHKPKSNVKPAGFLSNVDRFGRRSSFDADNRGNYPTPQQRRSEARRKARRQDGYDSDDDADIYYGGRRGRRRQFRGNDDDSDNGSRFSYNTPARRNNNNKKGYHNKYQGPSPGGGGAFHQVFRAVQERQAVELSVMLEEAQRKLQQQVIGNIAGGMMHPMSHSQDAIDVSNMILASGIMGMQPHQQQQQQMMMMHGMHNPAATGMTTVMMADPIHQQMQHMQFQGLGHEQPMLDRQQVTAYIGSNGMEIPLHEAMGLEEKYIPINIVNAQQDPMHDTSNNNSNNNVSGNSNPLQESPTIHADIMSPQLQQLMISPPPGGSPGNRGPPSTNNNNYAATSTSRSDRNSEPSYTARINQQQQQQQQNNANNNPSESQRSANQQPDTPSLPTIDPPTNRIFKKGKGGGGIASTKGGAGLTGVESPNNNSNKGGSTLPMVPEVKSNVNSPSTSLFANAVNMYSNASKARGMFQGLVKRTESKEEASPDPMQNNRMPHLYGNSQDVGRVLEIFAFRTESWEKIELLAFDNSKRMYKIKYPNGSVQWLDITKKPIREVGG